MPLSLPALMTLIAVLWLVITGIHGGARPIGKYKVVRARHHGRPRVRTRLSRADANELETLVAFLPAMWIYAWFGNPRFAAIACGMYVVGRILYALGYWRDARQRRTSATRWRCSPLSITWVAALVSVVSLARLRLMRRPPKRRHFGWRKITL